METVLRLRFGYGQIIPWVRRDKATGAVTAVAGPDSVWLRTPGPADREGHGPRGDVRGVSR